MLAEHLQRESGITIVNEVTLNQLILRFATDRPDDESDAITRKTIEKIREEATLFAGGARWRGRDVLRLSVINFQTTADEARLAAESIVAAFRSVSRG